MHGTITRLSSFFVATAFLLSGFVLSGCGEGGNSGPEASAEKGTLVVSITDAEGDLRKYEVDIQSIKLRKANGTEVETLPNHARIDFSQYVDMEEIVSTASVPLGAYTHATMVLDYTQADIQVDVGGVATPARVVDQDGNPMTVLEVTVALDTNRPLVIAPGLSSHLSLDFDLAATNAVDTTASPPVVRVEPMLIADVNPDLENLKKHRMRGPLLSIHEADETFEIGIRPFRLLLDPNRRHFGKLKVVTAPTTVYEVDGKTGIGREGFALLAEKPIFTAVIVLGELHIRDGVFKAREVFAGDSVPGGDRDALRGSVIARNGDRLTVHGVTLIRSDGAVLLKGNVTVIVGENTKVTRQGEHVDDNNPLDKDDISVGQRILVFGKVSGTLPDALTIDATEGHVRMRYTHVAGTVVSIRPDAAELTLHLQYINGLGIGIFDFTGTGSRPEAYIVRTRSLNKDNITGGDPLRLRGHVAPFGAAPPDFFAKTAIDVHGKNTIMAVRWHPPSASPFLSDSASGLKLDLTGMGRLHHVFHGRLAIPLTPAPAPQVLPKKNGRGRYAIRQADTITIHSDFGNFVRDINNRLTMDATLGGLYAKGRYIGPTQTIFARRVTVGLR
ncbi:MAG: DUF4382 domain-containing protein [Nitrospiria bacterium]